MPLRATQLKLAAFVFILGVSTSARAQGQEPRPAERITGYSLVGAGALSLGASGYFGLKSLAARARVAGACDGELCPEGAESEYDSARHFDRLSLITLTGGVAAAAAGGYLLLQSSDSDESGFRPAWSRKGMLGLSLAGLGAVGLVSGGAYAVAIIADSNRAAGECEFRFCGAEQRGVIESAHDEQGVALALMLGGAAAMGAGLYLFATDTVSSRERNQQGQAWLRAGVGRLELGSSF